MMRGGDCPFCISKIHKYYQADTQTLETTMIDFYTSNNTTAVHMLLPSELVEELDLYKTRYVSRTQLVAIAIQEYLKVLEASDVTKKEAKSSWVLFSRK